MRDPTEPGTVPAGTPSKSLLMSARAGEPTVFVTRRAYPCVGATSLD
jgi:hypothetical protein